MKNPVALDRALQHLTKLACLCGGLFTLSLTAGAQNEMGTAGQAGTKKPAGKIILVPGDGSRGTAGEIADPSAFGLSAAAVRIVLDADEPRYRVEDPSFPGGFFLIDVADFNKLNKSSASSSPNIRQLVNLKRPVDPGEGPSPFSFQIGDPVAYSAGGSSQNSLGTVGLATGRQNKQVDRQDSSQGREASIGTVGNVGGFVAHQSGNNNNSLGTAGLITNMQLKQTDRQESSQGREGSIGTVGNVGNVVAHGSSGGGAQSLGTVGQVGDPVAHSRQGFTTLGRFGQAGGLQPKSSSAASIGEPGDPRPHSRKAYKSLGNFGQAGGLQPKSSAAASIGEPGDPRPHSRKAYKSLGNFGQVGGLQPKSSAAASIGEPGDPRPHSRKAYKSLGNFGQAGGLQPKSSAAASIGEPGDPQPHSRKAYKSLGNFGQAGGLQPKSSAAASQSVGIRRLEGPVEYTVIEPVHEPGGHEPIAHGDTGEGEGSVQSVVLQKVVVQGRSGVEYALYLLPMGSANGPAILVSQGMLFGSDASEEPRSFVLQIPVEFAIQLVAL